MRVGYVTSYDPGDVNNWSGLGFFIKRCLERAGLTVLDVGPLAPPRSLRIYAKRLARRRPGAKSYFADRDPLVSQHYARQIEERLESMDVDILFSPGTIPLSYLDVSHPVVFWADATFASMREFYGEFGNVAERSITAGEELERMALERADLALYASEWAARSAVSDYGADPAKVNVIPFGANLEREPDANEVESLIDARTYDACNLLFLGIDWDRKGGDVAVEAARELNSAGIPTVLSVVGADPELPKDAESFVRVHGLIDKATAAGRRELAAILSTSHFLIHPARAEAYGLALCEASAFGVPSLATSVGGITTIVREGQNGVLFEREAQPSAFAEVIRSLMGEPAKYRTLARSSFEEYRTRLNWSTSGARVASLLEGLLAGGARDRSAPVQLGS